MLKDRGLGKLRLFSFGGKKIYAISLQETVIVYVNVW